MFSWEAFFWGVLAGGLMGVGASALLFFAFLRDLHEAQRRLESASKSEGS